MSKKTLQVKDLKFFKDRIAKEHGYGCWTMLESCFSMAYKGTEPYFIKSIYEYVSYREQQASAKAFEEGKDNIVKNLNSEFERLQQSSESLKDILYLDGVLAVINTREIVNPYKTDNHEL